MTITATKPKPKRITKLDKLHASWAQAVRASLPAAASGMELAATAKKLAMEIYRDLPPAEHGSVAVQKLGCFITAERDAAIIAGDIKLTEAWFDAWRVFFHGPNRIDRLMMAQEIIDQANAGGGR
jgi:hypothetical protein